MDADQGHILTDEEYQLFLRLQEAFNQRAMGLGGGQHTDILSKIIFNGHNAEEFISKFPHICSSFQVDRIFYTDNGLVRPNEGPEQQIWDQLDSKAYRVLEKHLDGDIRLTGTVRSISIIEQEMEMTRMSDSASLTSHFSITCRSFRELAIHGQALTDRQKNNQDDV